MFRTSKTGLRAKSILLVDANNVLANGEVRWERLADAILRKGDLNQTDLIHAGVYAFRKERPDHIAKWIKDRFETFGRLLTFVEPVNELFIEARTGKDIDSYIKNDLWKTIVGYEKRVLKEEAGRNIYPLQIRIILVSGDGGYLETYDDLLEAFNETDEEPRLELDFVLYAPKNAMHDDYLALAAEHRVTLRFLEEIEGFYVKKTQSAL